MKDVVLLFAVAVLGFPLGAGLASFILWMDKQKRPPRHRSATAIPVGIAIFGVGTNLNFVVLNAAQHNWHQTRAHSFEVVLFVLAACGAWLVTRHAHIEPPDRPNYGDET